MVLLWRKKIIRDHQRVKLMTVASPERGKQHPLGKHDFSLLPPTRLFLKRCRLVFKVGRGFVRVKAVSNVTKQEGS